MRQIVVDGVLARKIGYDLLIVSLFIQVFFICKALRKKTTIMYVCVLFVFNNEKREEGQVGLSRWRQIKP